MSVTCIEAWGHSMSRTGGGKKISGVCSGIFIMIIKYDDYILSSGVACNWCRSLDIAFNFRLKKT